MKWPRDSWLGLMGMALGSIVFIISRSIEDWEFDVLGASFFPKFSAILMFFFGFMLFLTSVLESKSITEKQNLKKDSNTLIGNVFFIFVLIIYVSVLPFLGFMISTLILILIMFFLIVKNFTPKYLFQGILFSFLSISIIWYIFTKQFSVILP